MRWQIVFLLRDFVVAPHTFVRPKRVPTSPRPEIGSKAPDVLELRDGRPAVIAFLRHVGCPFAEATVREMVALARDRPSVDFVAVTHSNDAASHGWCKAFAGAGLVRLVADPTRARYAAWGVGLSDREHFAGRDSLEALQRLLDRGIHNRWASGNRWQPAATFAVNPEGVVRWLHFPRHAGDLPSFEDALGSVV
jgi:hypothetical protein